MYVVIYGADYCSYTQALWKVMHKFPFLYIPYTPDKTKEDYWEKLVKLLHKKIRFTFPTIILVDHNAIQMVEFQNGHLLNQDTKQIYNLKDLRVPLIPARLTIKNKDQLKDALAKNEIFVYTNGQ